MNATMGTKPPEKELVLERVFRVGGAPIGWNQSLDKLEVYLLQLGKEKA